MQLFAYAFGEPLSNQGLLGDGLLGGDLFEGLNLGRIHFNRDVLQTTAPPALENLAAQLFVEAEFHLFMM